MLSDPEMLSHDSLGEKLGVTVPVSVEEAVIESLSLGDQEDVAVFVQLLVEVRVPVILA